MTSTSAPLLGDLIARAHHTAICVDDFDAARDFYVDILGFAVEGEMDHRGEPNLGRVVGLPGAVVRWGMLVRGEYRIRSEERRVGKECVSTCRSGGAPDH